MTEAEATGLYLSGLKPTMIVLLEQDKLISRQQAKINDLERQFALAKRHPSTPSGMQAAFTKANRASASKRKKKKGKRRGIHRPPPSKIDETKEHVLDRCPDCCNPLPPASETRQRFTEELPVVKPRVIKHVIYRYWCRVCRKIVESPVTDALPKSAIGLRTVVYSAWLHYILGVSFDKIIQLLNLSAHFKISTGGLFGAWHNLARILQPLYDQVGRGAKWSAVLHADETSWRVNGCTHWLWCFTNKHLAYYVIDRCRGSPVALRVLGKYFAGVLVTDFLAAYGLIRALAKQKCLVHLLREIIRVNLFDSSPQWKDFRNQLKRLVLDGLRLGRQRVELNPACFERRKALLRQRLVELYVKPCSNENAGRLRKRLERHRNEIFTFLDFPEVTADNNHAERQIRPAVVSRKTSYGNRSKQGADTQAMLLSIFRTLELRGYNPVNTLLFLAQEHLRTGKPMTLPPTLACTPTVEQPRIETAAV
ncbi:MAG: IS66 family transposase [Candidatus Sungbacteria bacterium]|uniref:IS66 family transposase n=1 Tax=Candidatus Sungiibacteriota bacterium TaxID=2750080 RepID=A0A932QYC3_9BACT|nr:IS66 family transposase [Candidatus Sungbacteria bacterium]